MSYVNWINRMDNKTFCDSGQGLDTMLMIFFDEFREFIHQVDTYEYNKSNIHFKNTFTEDGTISFSITVDDEHVEEFLAQVRPILDSEEVNKKVEVTQNGSTFNFRYLPDVNSYPVSLHNN